MLRSRFWLGVLATLAVQALVGLIVLFSGVVDVAATRANPVADRVLAFASTRSIRHHAGGEPNPLANDPAALKTGLSHYREMCVTCHGGPGAEPAELAAGLHPEAPDLTSPSIQAFSDGMLYATIAHGIGSTGMPAFGQSHSTQELWSLVAFVRHLPKLTAEERAQLGAAAKGEHGHDEHADEHGSAQPTHEEKPAAQGPRSPQVHKVTISGSKFDPATLEVQQGDTIEWVNTDFVAHTATADDHSFDTGRMDDGVTKRIVAKTKGTFPYYCRYHNGMRGTLTVH